MFSKYKVFTVLSVEFKITNEQRSVLSPGMAAQCAKIIELQIYFVPPRVFGRLSPNEQCSLLLRHSFSIISVSEDSLGRKLVIF